MKENGDGTGIMDEAANERISRNRGEDEMSPAMWPATKVPRVRFVADAPRLAVRYYPITPHIAGATQQARQRLMDATVANVAIYLAGRPTNVVNHHPG